MAEKFRSRKFFLTKKKSVDECCDTNSQNSFFLRTFSPETWPNNVLFSTIFSYLFRFDSSRWQVCVRAHVKSTRKEFKRWNGLTTCAKQFTTFFSLSSRSFPTECSDYCGNSDEYWMSCVKCVHLISRAMLAMYLDADVKHRATREWIERKKKEKTNERTDPLFLILIFLSFDAEKSVCVLLVVRQPLSIQLFRIHWSHPRLFIILLFLIQTNARTRYTDTDNYSFIVICT